MITGLPGFSGGHDQADIAFGPAPKEPIDLSMRLVIQTPDGKHLAALPARMIARTAGIRGMTLHGRDTTGVIDARLRLDSKESRFSLSLTSTWSEQPVLPGAALPILRFLRRSVPPNTLSFKLDDTLTTTPVTVPAEIAVPEETVFFVEDLDRLQTAAGELFPVPRDWTADDLRQVRRAAQLLAGKRVAAGITSVSVGVPNLQKFIETFEKSLTSTFRATPSEPYIARVAGHELDLGPYTVEIVGGTARTT